MFSWLYNIKSSLTILAAGVDWTQLDGIHSPLKGFVKQAKSPIIKKPSVTNENGGRQ